MSELRALFLVLMSLSFLIVPSVSPPLCTDFSNSLSVLYLHLFPFSRTIVGTPRNLTEPLKFCSYNVTSCCDSERDSELEKQFGALNIPDSSCADRMKDILCSHCDPFAADIFDARLEETLRPFPILCNSVESSRKPQSKQSAMGYCSTFWTSCHNVSMANSPFASAPLLRGRDAAAGVSGPSSIDQLWRSEEAFCNASSGLNSTVCFAGKTIFPETSESEPPIRGLCFEKLSNGTYLNMIEHPDGSNRAFLARQDGRVWLVTIPDQGSGQVIQLNESNLFIDLTDEVSTSSTLGLMGMAFHPDFIRNGRFFVSYNCDKSQNPNCNARCACNSDVNCDPSKLVSDNTGNQQPCRYHAVVGEYTVNGTSRNSFTAETVEPVEVRRIFTMGLPSNKNHGGQLLFGPDDKYMYFMMGDGSTEDDPFNLAQNKKSLLGKIMRLDIDRIPSASEVTSLGLWGHYSIPEDNPYREDDELQNEIWALGFRSPWRCTFDTERPRYFLCADIGQDHYEEVNLVTKYGNYGWSRYEGYKVLNSSKSLASGNATTLIFPILGYTHSEIDGGGSAAIVGGFFYRSRTDPCLYGRYLYADVYGSIMWAAVETPLNSGNFSATSVPFTCAFDSPLACSTLPGSRQPPSGYVFSFGQDNNKDVYVLSTSGVYRLVHPGRCNYTCSEDKSTVSPTISPPHPPSFSIKLRWSTICKWSVLLSFTFILPSFLRLL